MALTAIHYLWTPARHGSLLAVIWAGVAVTARGGNVSFMGLIPEGAAARSAGLRWAMGTITVAVLAADQVSKSLVLAAHPAGVVGTGWISVRLVRNTGASGGLASGYPVLVTLAAVAITALAATIALRVRGRVAALCLAAVLGGATGNLADRLFRAPGFGRGGVVDWIHLGVRGGSMDVADVAIQLGVIGAFVAILVGERVRRTRSAPEARQAGESR
jgi:signal peptidase II